jgi:splicing factor 3A subunit 3
MPGSALERVRSVLESAELKEQAIVEQLNSKVNGQKSKVWQQHKVNLLAEGIVADSELALPSLETSALKTELDSMRGPNMFSSFYEKIKETREYYVRFPHLNVESEGVSLPDPDVKAQFSGEEIFGKYLDLHGLFLQYCNLPHVPASHDQDYLQYLDKFNTFFYIPENCKSTKQYKRYIADLWDYLSGYLSRIQPLVNSTELIDSWKSEFEANWTAGNVPGWKRHLSASAPQPLRLGMFNSVEELEALGLDRLKQALEALGLKCGGTLKDRAERLWSVRGKKPEDIPQKLKAAPAKGSTSTEIDTHDWHKEVSVCLAALAAVA